MGGAGGRLAGVLLLLAACAAWGTSFPVIKLLVGELSLDPAAYTAFRSLITLLLLAPVLAASRRRPRATTKHLLLGLSYALGLYLQGLGTGLTTASNSAFITSLHMVFVYAYESLIMGRGSPVLLLAIALAAAGVYLLVGGLAGVCAGDLVVLVSAVFWAAQVVLVSQLSRTSSVAELLFWQAAVAALIFTPPALLVVDSEALLNSVPGLAYLAAVPGLLAFALQVLGQRRVGATEASIIYSSEPLFASIFAYMMLGETFTPPRLAGAALILAATMIVAVAA